jgi:hypothetical protein
LLERALGIDGSHLGSIWIKPQSYDSLFHSESLGIPKTKDSLSVNYPSRPIQIAKIVHETSVIWSKSKADPTVANQFASGTEVSCSILDSVKNPQPTSFCYVVEVNRSPLAPQKPEEIDPIQREVFSPRALRSAKSKPIKAVDTAFRHQPIQYSLVIHPPIVIEVSIDALASNTFVDII